MGSDETQKVCRENVDKLKRNGFYQGRNSSFDKALKSLLSLYELLYKSNKNICEKWIKKKQEEK